jgi:hypothetical protein
MTFYQQKYVYFQYNKPFWWIKEYTILAEQYTVLSNEEDMAGHKVSI